MFLAPREREGRVERINIPYIILVALHPNATHTIQPLDVSYFRTFKLIWQRIHKKSCEEFSTVGIKKSQFAPTLKKVLDELDNKKLLSNGFKKCGLYPFNVQAIDFSKIINNNSDESVDNTKNQDLPSNSNSLTVIENLLRIS